MADIRAEDRVEPGAERVELAERHGVHAVVRLAAEIERPGKEVDPVFLASDLAGGVVVVYRHPAIDLVLLAGGPAVAAAQLGGDVLVAVFVDELGEQGAVELARMHVCEALLAAPLPVLDQIGKELGGPADPAFEKGEIDIRETPRDPAQEQRLGDRMAGGGEMADMVEGEIARRVAQAKAAAAGVKGWRHLELAAFLPDRVVIVVAVEPDLVIMHGKAGDLGGETLGGRQLPPDGA